MQGRHTGLARHRDQATKQATPRLEQIQEDKGSSPRYRVQLTEKWESIMSMSSPLINAVSYSSSKGSLGLGT